jgi:hypothetical protein
MGVYRRVSRVRPRFSLAPRRDRGGNRGGRSQLENLARQLADQIIRERDAAAQRARLGRIYTRFDHHNDVLPNNIETVTRGLFSGNTGSLTMMYTSSLLTLAQKSYYAEIFANADPADSSQARSEFSLAYGHLGGSGSVDTTGNLNNDTPARAIYKQYAQILLPPNDKKFTINGVDTNHIYVANFNRGRMREKIDPGNFEVTFAQLSGGLGINVQHQDHTGSNIKLSGTGQYIQVIDDSSLTAATLGEGGQVYNLVSGSLDGGTTIFNGDDPTYFGLLYPQHGIAIFNADTLDNSSFNGGFGANFATGTGSQVEGHNFLKFFHSISASNALTPVDVNGGVQARSSEQVKSTYYFVRVKNAEYNYSNNPTFTTGSLGSLAFSSFINDPQTYITTIGLYNNRRELLAVAKMSQAILKNYTREALIKVKLDF